MLFNWFLLDGFDPNPEIDERHRVPSDSLITANLRRFLTDPKVFPDPKQFRPERFLSPDGAGVVKYEQMVPFGLGKRICMGEGLARDTTYLVLS